MKDVAKSRNDLLQRLSALERDLPLAKEGRRIAAEVLANGKLSRELPDRPTPNERQFMAWELDLQEANRTYERICSEIRDTRQALHQVDSYGLQPS